MKVIKIVLIVSFLIFLTASFNQAQANGLVPCGGRGEPRCNICHLFLLLQKIITFVRNLAFIIAPIFIVV